MQQQHRGAGEDEATTDWVFMVHLDDASNSNDGEAAATWTTQKQLRRWSFGRDDDSVAAGSYCCSSWLLVHGCLGLAKITCLQQGQSVEQESEEIRKLRQQLSDVYQAWVSDRPPPQGPLEGTSTIPQATQTPLHAMSNHILPLGYVPNYSLHTTPGTSNMRPPVALVRNTPLVVSGAPVYTIPSPPPVTRPNNEPLSHAYDGQYYPPNMAFGVSAPYNQTPQYESPVENEKLATTVELDEMARKIKSLEQNIKNIQGLGGHKSISFNDLCMFPHIHLPRGFKTPKFEKYDGHDDPIALLKRYCNQLRGAGGKEELLIAYFGESLVGAFIKQFQYNIDIAPDRNSLSNMKKKPTESFREYAIKWREQAARVKPPMDNHELITIFLEAQEPD
ncbi:uncharacterized protein [Nicotiana sylvestris]|uniref:uncharacterized protein n=1 Tax=Nicotiana sylvestris TaxID=4096 RepID=UPI00388CEAD8